jgi:hypothetical protein
MADLLEPTVSGDAYAVAAACQPCEGLAGIVQIGSQSAVNGAWH